MTSREGILGEVRDFLDGLALDLPLIFQKGQKPAAAARKRVHKHVPYRGRDIALCVVETPELRRSEIAHEGDELILRRGADRAAPQQVLREWLVDRARETFAERVAHWAPLIGVAFKRVSIRDQRTVWGSCTRAGDLSFNWRIVMAPPETLDYLVIHELCHRLEMNHSKRYWANVAKHCPDWKKHREWLREHSRRLKGAVRRAS